MSDDPYDFEIAIPAALNNGRSTSKHPSTIDSGEDASDVSGSLSNMSGISSDNDDNDSDRGMRQRTESTVKQQPAKRTNEFRTATPSSGSALDRAKNFLSKYSSGVTGDSNGSNTPTSSRSRRVSLDLDDDDDSFIESSGGDTEITSNKNAVLTASSALIGSKIQDCESSQTSINYDDAQKRGDTELKHVEALQEDRSSQSSDRCPLSKLESNAAYVPPTRRTATTLRHDESKSEDEDSIESYHSGASDERSGTVTATATPSVRQPRSSYQEESADDYNESFQEESLSQTNVVANHYHDTQRSRATPTFTSMQSEQSIASESGVYEEDVFEEDSAAVARTVAVAPHVVANANAEKTFDYSMDFSDDEVGGHEPPQSATNDRVQRDPKPESSEPRSLSGQSDNEEQSAFLQSDSFHEVWRQDNAIDIVDPITTEQLAVEQLKGTTNNEVPVAYSAPMPEQVPERSLRQQEPTSSAEDSIVGNENDQRAPSHKVVSMPHITVAPIQKVNTPKARSAAEDLTAAQRPHVTIIRAIELKEEKRVEMKDASTQFTGNHAAIQADLIPDGMHNLFVSTPSAPATTSLDQGIEVPSRETEPIPCQNEQQPPPPPSISQQLGSTMYSLDALKLPIMTSTSVFKQQLLALQEQILQKKRETERIVRDRITFQYSSLRGTERFIAARRAQKLELWEALMRVDPTLDERKAREVARLAQSATT
ncbi:hypothetical protein PC116_g17998 [Phytophthora cactorum]|uniref:Uncharacterized protein n=2 Tax=Phytophthora cactorum TaxID=29920 RepID=A0A8T1BPJ7_9STRA|nr:hypothetical protein PC111_g15039 [Phytophthora cactorum]KAG2851623.1 hypothetical protein PC113_g15747 [Phytophthora cactorum]KAG2891754.1 hypothetical protein PC114_g16892 [Phytophthora cactorum]KAG2906120.1 hypothetical protein PC115_g14374 [Phytophthora cactorum]KAG2922343.1 hypothetical protein PC117_g16003 [Phytophthora cactorum]